MKGRSSEMQEIMAQQSGITTLDHSGMPVNALGRHNSLGIGGFHRDSVGPTDSFLGEVKERMTVTSSRPENILLKRPPVSRAASSHDGLSDLAPNLDVRGRTAPSMISPEDYGLDKYDIGTGFGHFAIATADVYKLAEDIKTKGGIVTREAGPVKGGTSVIAFAKDPDGYLFELIERPGTPEPLCQVMLRVGDLDRSIKFYEKALGMKLCRTIDRPEQKYTLAMMGYAEEKETIVLELTYNYGVTEYTKGNAYAQVAISTTDVYKSAEAVNHVIQELGGKVTRQAGPLPGLGTKILSFLDPDGWKTVLVDHEDFLKELHQKE